MKKTTLFCVVILISLSRALCAAETSAAEQKVWEKTADFGGAKPVSRLALDIPVDLDLRCESGISFEMRSESLDKFSRINIYFKQRVSSSLGVSPETFFNSSRVKSCSKKSG